MKIFEKMKSLFSGKGNILLTVFLVLSVVMIAVMAIAGRGDTYHEENASMLITEVMAKNLSTLTDSDGEYHDWIELCNAGNEPMSMEGWYLSDSIDEPYRWAFPPVTVQPGEYLVVFASGKDKYDTRTGEYHSNFRISSSGEEIVLTNPDSQVLERAEVGESQADISLGRVLTEEGARYFWFAEPSPGANNEGEYAANIYELPSPVSGIIINEYMNDNTRTVYDSDGDYSDWVELYNTTGEDIDLTACFLSDSEQELDKWSFPDGFILPAKSYAVVFLSGKDKYENGELHAGFGLSRADTRLFLCDSATRAIDDIELADLGENISAGYSADGEWVFFTLPTPGKENEDLYFNSISALRPLADSLMISEVCAAQTDSETGLPQTDWIELYNGSSSVIDLRGYTLSNDIALPGLYSFGSTKLAAGEYFVIEAAGDKAVSGQAGFNIDCGGEEIFLFAPDGRVIDSFSTGKLRIGVTSGRSGDGTADRYFYDKPTKGEPNASGCSSYAAMPEILASGGYVSSGTKVEIKVPEKCTVRYTVDGSEPDSSSPEYTGPIKIEESMTLKVRSFAEGKLPSDRVFATFLVEKEHSIPVICVSSAPDGLFSEESGIFNNTRKDKVRPYFTSNFWMDWEREMDVEYYVDGRLQVTFSAGAKITGYYSRALDKKSFALHVRGIYGASSVVYPFFGEDSPGTAKSLVLRGGGQDQTAAMVRDEFCAEVLRRSSGSVISADWQPVAVYINGQYWGMYYLREKINEDYLEANYSLPKTEVDIIYNRSKAIAGTMDAYTELLEYMQSNDMNDPAVWEYVQSQVDIESAVDYCIFEAFFDNYDSKNIRSIKTPDTKWQWIFFDLDAALHEDSKSNIGHLYLARTDRIIRQLFENDSFVDMYVKRYTELLNSAFMPEELDKVLGEILEQIEDEMERDCERWDIISYERWQKNVDKLRRIMGERREKVIDWLMKEQDISLSESQQMFI